MTFALARRFFRSRNIRSVAIGFAVVVALLICISSTLKALDLSPDQVVEQNLGAFDAKLDLTGTVNLKPGESFVSSSESKEQRLPARVSAEIYSTDIRLGGADNGYAPFIETNWADEPFPDRYKLSSGRWGSSPGEIVITNPPGSATLGSQLRVLSGNTDWQVVGIAEDRYGRFSSLLASPGTWADLEPQRLKDFRVLEASPRLYASTDAQAQMLSFAKRLIALKADAKAASSFDPESTIQTSDSIADVARRSSGQKSPVAYFLPAILFPILIVLLPLTLFEREFRQRLALLDALGVGRIQSWAGLWAAFLCWLVIGGLLGCAVGTLLALAARPAIAAFHPLPLSPSASPILPYLQATLIASLAAGIGLAATARASRDRHRRNLKARSQLPNEVWRSALFILIAAIVVESFMLDSIQRWMILMGTIAVLVAISGGRLTRLTAQMLRPRSLAAASLALRKMSDPAGRSGALVATIAVGTGLACGMLILASSVVSSGKSESTPNVMPGQMAVNGVGGILEPATPAVQKLVARELASSAQPITISFLGSIDAPVWARDDGYGFVGVFESVDQLEAFFPAGLTASAVATLKSGGAIRWDDQPGERRLQGADPDDVTTLSAEQVEAPPVRWGESIVVALLHDGARKLNFPISTGATVYDGGDASRGESIKELLRAEGLDPDQVETYSRPTTPAPPLLIVLASISLLLLLFATTLFAARTQVDSLKSVFATALAIGLPPGWCKRVAVTELALSTLVATSMALAIAWLPAIVASTRISGLALDIPWLAVVALFAAVYTTGFAANALAFRDLSSASEIGRPSG